MEDEITKALSVYYPDWIAQISSGSCELVNGLLSLFDYYSHKTVNEALKELHLELTKKRGVTFDNTLFTVLEQQGGRINSSYRYICEYQTLNNISKYVIHPNLQNLTIDMQDIKNVVMVDDFCGSGQTFIDYYNTHADLLRSREVFYIVIHVMKDAQKRIEQFARDEKVNITILCYASTEKAFSRESPFFLDKEMFMAESERLKISEKYILGFQKTEALVSFYNDTPNNTLGLFWKNGENYKPLFCRKNDKRPAWKILNRDMKRRQNSNYLEAANKNRV